MTTRSKSAPYAPECVEGYWVVAYTRGEPSIVHLCSDMHQAELLAMKFNLAHERGVSAALKEMRSESEK